jgi:glycine/D-amino acid oxidase-like deaminating enzyme
VVVIGGGVIGTSVAYHLAQMGCSDVVLLERDRLTCGTTWHAAGLMVTFGSTSQTSTEMRKYTRDLYSRLEAETGLATGFDPVGFIEIANEPDRLDLSGRGRRAVPAGAHGRHTGWFLCQGGRPGQPRRRHDVPGQGGAAARSEGH